MITLSISLNGNHCSEYFRYNGKLYKAVVRNGYNGNGYFEVYLYRETRNGDFAEIACRFDIEGLRYISYHRNDNEKIEDSKYNIMIIKEWVKKVYTK